MTVAAPPLRERFIAPAAWLPAERLAACFAGALPAEQALDLAAQPRFQARMGRLLAAHFQLSHLEQTAECAGEDDLRVLLLPADALARLPRWCGAVLHGATLAREIRRDQVNQLQARLGRELFTLAVAHRAVGRATHLLLDADALVGVIDRDGQACVASWLQSLDPALQGWARLVLHAPARASTDAQAGQIVRLVAWALAAERSTVDASSTEALPAGSPAADTDRSQP
ncbi:type III secretion protein [Stutzerimonas chloritidismutans]|uniref:type III secretion protein n=1 Tax=Stutzerimonas chloritidismutans TaxID=203192 RepID=UPI003F14A9E0